MAFDTGPGNMVIDRLMQKLFNKDYDRNGAVARKGSVLQPVLEQMPECSYISSRSRRRPQAEKNSAANMLRHFSGFAAGPPSQT